MRQARKQWILLVASLFICLLAFEAVLRVLDIPRAYRIPEMHETHPGRYAHRRSDTPGLAYELECTDKHPGLTNVVGLRDTIEVVRKATGRRRVVCLGDSFTYGLGVGMMDSYPKRLGHYLREKHPEWQVLKTITSIGVRLKTLFSRFAKMPSDCRCPSY